MKNFNPSLLCLSLLLTNLNAFAANNDQDLKKMIADFVLKSSVVQEDEEVQVQVLKLDKNFKLPSCDNKIQVKFAKEGIPIQNNTVQISCSSFPEWNIYIPIHVKVFKPVLAASHYMPSGTTITANDVYYAKLDKKQLPEGFYLNQEQILGLSTLHAIPSGVAFTPKNVKQKVLVKRNHSIKLVLKKSGINIEMMGIAKSNGILNETIKIMNPSSKKIIYGVVTGPSRVEIST